MKMRTSGHTSSIVACNPMEVCTETVFTIIYDEIVYRRDDK